MGSRYIQQQSFISSNHAEAGHHYQRYQSHPYSQYYPEYQYPESNYVCHDPYGASVLTPEYQEFACQCDECVCSQYAYYGASTVPHPQQPSLPDCEIRSEYDYSEGHASDVEATTPRELDSVATEECTFVDAVGGEPMKYIFIGQLPFAVENGKINWLVRFFGRASKVFSVEPQYKEHRDTGVMQHKGCAHVLVLRSEVEFIVRNLHHHMLMSKDTVMYGEPDCVHFWAGKVFDTSVRVASKPVTCESSHRQVRK